MKNAIGELNGSVITVMAVASLTVLFFMFIWPMLKTNLKNDARCSDAICDVWMNKNNMVYCYNPGKSGAGISASDVFECPFRG